MPPAFLSILMPIKIDGTRGEKLYMYFKLHASFFWGKRLWGKYFYNALLETWILFLSTGQKIILDYDFQLLTSFITLVRMAEWCHHDLSQTAVLSRVPRGQQRRRDHQRRGCVFAWVLCLETSSQLRRKPP